MRRSFFVWMVFALFVGLGAATPTFAEEGSESMSESWYLLRGRANMKIGNYKAAIEAFEKATERNPGNRESMRSLGIAYEKQGLTTRAIEQFDRYLERFDDDSEIAFKQAEYLAWERYAYRRDDAIRYFRMGLRLEDDPARRHRMARLLAQDRARLEEALEQYRILLEAEPGNATWRAEYRDLLLWDPKHLAEAIAEYRKLVAERPDDFETRRTLARLVDRKDPRGDEPVTMYRDLVARRPKDSSLRLDQARVLARHSRHRAEALEQYRRVLAERKEIEPRIEYADLLSEKSSDRAAALEQYQTLLRARPDDVPIRLKYARLLAAERSDTERAIEQYDQVLARDPRQPAAHEGLAAAYAWQGDRDRALHHSDLALRYGGGGRRASSLREDLLVGREPRVEPFVHGLIQRGPSRSKLNGIRAGVRGQLDPTPFLTLKVGTGFEDYWRSGENTAGAWLSGDAELRLDPERKIGVGLGYHSLGRSSARNVLARAAYSVDREGLEWQVGFARSPREDSYVALAGERVGGVRIGAARENRFSGRIRKELGRFGLSASPYAGWVDADRADDNPFVGLGTGADYAIHDSERWTLSGTLGVDLHHYRDDAFGVRPGPSDPEPGGYFSPRFFFEVQPGLSSRVRIGREGFVEVEGGPALQLVDASGDGVDTQVGGRARLAYLHFVRESLYWNVGAGFVRIGDAYTRGDLQVGMTVEF
ncbi:MAG: tetratricopeptide repeat protein [Myxococcota bacterium]